MPVRFGTRRAEEPALVPTSDNRHKAHDGRYTYNGRWEDPPVRWEDPPVRWQPYDPWPNWTMTTHTTSVTIYDPWPHWAITPTYATNTADASISWIRWVTSDLHPAPKPLTPEQVAQIEAEVQAQREAAARRREEQLLRAEAGRVADIRARELLDTLLTDAQRQTMRGRGYFDVVGSRGRLYRIRTGGNSMAGNVEWLEPASKMVMGRFCCHPSGVPVADGWASQLLNLQLDEDHFLGLANLSQGRKPRHDEVPAILAAA